MDSGGTQGARLWGGRFAADPAQAMEDLSRSIDVDFRLAPYDIAQTCAHVRALERAGLLAADEAAELLRTLSDLADEISRGTLQPDPRDEDIHTAIERQLLERLGELGGRVRAGRSRNDQVATDFRLYLRDQARRLVTLICALQYALLEQAQQHAALPAPGFTHLQHAQPVSLGHELAKHVHSLARDIDRLKDWDTRAAASPLGAGALAGTSLGLDAPTVARELGFAAVVGNSIDAVSDRDWVAEFCFCTAMIGVHLSRLGEEIILWTSTEFGWARLDDAWATGSSIMPQKKNPDVAELARGKAGRLIGNLMGLLAVLKGLPFAYNRDLQEDKPPVFDSIDQLGLVLPALTGLMATLQFNVDVVSAGAAQGHALATDIAEWLVRQGVPFRQAHEAAGTCVRAAEANNCQLWELSDADLSAIHPALTPQVRQVLSVTGSMAARDGVSGTAPAAVMRQLAALEPVIAADQAWGAKPLISL